MIESWILWTALAVGGACFVAMALLTAHGRTRRIEPGTPAPELLDDTNPIDVPNHALHRCPHDVPLNRQCSICDGILRGKHVTLDGEDDGPRVPPPPPVGPKGAA